MKINLTYTFGALVALPLLPVMYFQAKRIIRSVPKLPEATQPNGTSTFSETSKNLRLLTIGESTIAGVGVDTHENGFSGSLAKHLSEKLKTTVSWTVYAKSGYTAKNVSEKILPKIEEKNFDLIVIGLGGNNAFQLNSIQKWRNEILELISELRTKFEHVPIVFTNMPPIHAFPAFTPTIKLVIGNLVRLFGKELKAITDQQENVYHNAVVVTLEDWKKDMNLDIDLSEFFSDGIHPSPLAYQVWGKDMARFIIENVDLKR